VAVLLLVAFVPILEIAKLASAFGILVFVLVNVAVVVFRESDVPYDPSFRSPLYPWTQVVGVGGGVVVLVGMGPLPLAGAVSIVAAGVLWYAVYGRPRVDREGALVGALRGRLRDRAVTETARVVAGRTGYEAMVAVGPGTSVDREAALLGVAADLARPHGGRVAAVQFEEVPDQLPLHYASGRRSPADAQFERATADLADRLDAPVVTDEVVSHDTTHALANYARHRGVDVLVLAHPDLGPAVGRPWIGDRAPCDVVYVADPAYGRPLDGVTVPAGPGPADPVAVGVADAIACAHDVPLTLSVAGGRGEWTSADRAAYHRDLDRVCAAPVRLGNVRTDGSGDGARGDRGTEAFVVESVDESGRGRAGDGGTPAAGLVVQSRSTAHRRVGRRLLERVLY
jgi:hypothetical protein